jgi:hypothetical protein
VWNGLPAHLRIQDFSNLPHVVFARCRAVAFAQDFDFIMSNKISAIVNCAGSTVRT